MFALNINQVMIWQVVISILLSGIKFLSADITLVPSSYIDLDENQQSTFEKILPTDSRIAVTSTKTDA